MEGNTFATLSLMHSSASMEPVAICILFSSTNERPSIQPRIEEDP